MKIQTFHRDGHRKVLCPGCGYCHGELHLGEKKQRNLRCHKCRTEFIILPPEKITTDAGFKIIKYGPPGTFTADLTDIEDTDELAFDKSDNQTKM